MKISKSHKLKLAFAFCLLAFVSISVAARGKINLDYDGKADFLVYRPSNGTWYGCGTESGNNFAVRWGLSTDKPVPADYDGDGITDIAVFRPETSIWYVLKSSNGQLLTATWGLSTDVLVPADYDGDGQTDFAVWRSGTWYILTSTSGYNPQYFQSRTILPTDIPQSSTIPVPADYDGDGKTDFAVKFNNSWFILQSRTNSIKISRLQCDLGILAPSDYSGDGIAEPGCVYMQPDVTYLWRYIKSQDNRQINFFWGSGPNNDFPVPDDYDNDGQTDIAIYRNGQWWIYPSNTSQPYVVNFGVSQDIPSQFANLKYNN
jgi:FG-GAP-like repeat